MNLNLTAQTAVVVGAARGIGLAIARAFAAEKANVALLDLVPDVTAAASQLHDEFGVAALPLQGNVVDYAAMKQAAATVQGSLHRIDHVVFAVGIGSGKYGFPFWNLEPGDWGRVLEINVIGAVNVAHAFVPALIQNGAGSMLLISSVAGQIGSQTDPPYSASKAALINFAQCAAKDLAGHNVRVNSLCPGMVKTPLNRSVWEAWARLQPEDKRQTYEDWADDKIRRIVPLGRWQTAEDVAAMAVFLAAAPNVTGQTINVDGGFVMHW